MFERAFKAIWHQIYKLIPGFLKKPGMRWAEEDAAGVIIARLSWALAQRLLFLGAGVASAATFNAMTTTTLPRIRMMNAPRNLAMLTSTQKALVHEGLRYGPGSGIVYVWGGNSPLGFDCSGYVNFVYRKVGITIPRGSRAQWTYGGTDVSKGNERPGDVVYFHGSTVGPNAGPPPGHEGLYIGGGKYIEYYSSGRPAHVVYLRNAYDYMGAKRWYKPVQISYRFRYTIIWVARHFRFKISNGHGYYVTFRRPTGQMARWRFNAIRRWAHNHKHYFSGNLHYVTIKF